MPKSIAIIGAGVAGLAAGCYAQMNGYASEIFELHDLPGGLCTAWERRDYVFDGCIHYLLGTAPGQPYHTLWDELGVADIPAINHDEMMRVVGSDGRTFVLYCDPDQLEAHLVDLAPGDEKPLRAFCRGVRQFLDFDLSAMQAKPRQLMRATDGLALGRQMLPYLQPLVQWGRVSAADFAARLQDPFLRRAFELVFGWPEIPIMAGMSLLAAMQTQNAGFPAGGSLAFARALEARYLALGGTIHYKAQVEQILVENDRAVGVRLYDDSEHRADYVISAADGRGTIFHMLDGKYVER
ncbi:MAG: NAD(P)/FAD-dependent oxidoreductase, partial [Caldilineaceae bacterium]|nr:NAD(P)/FAD-dependent oxidoreductase [Caldilineaceae bacterium]